jgi:hypothetical protein
MDPDTATDAADEADTRDEAAASGPACPATRAAGRPGSAECWAWPGRWPRPAWWLCVMLGTGRPARPAATARRPRRLAA